MKTLTKDIHTGLLSQEPAEQDIAHAIAGLTAGIVFVDWLAVVDLPREMSFVFLALFGASLLGQRLTSAA